MCEKHWEAFINGDNESLTSLYLPYFEHLFFIALKYVKNTEVAQDITSELFTNLLETDIAVRKSKWSQIEDTKSFLATIIKCRALDYVKIEQNRTRILNENASPIITTEEQNKDEIEHLKYCILQLPLEEQKLLELHLAGYKNEEIAEKQNYSEKTVRNKLSLSRKKLIYLWKNLILILVWQL